MVRRDRRGQFLLTSLFCLATMLGHVETALAAPGRFDRWAFVVTYDPTSRASALSHLDQIDVLVPSYFRLQSDGSIGGTGDPILDGAASRADKRLMPMVQSALSGNALSPYLNDSGRRAALVAQLTGAVAVQPFRGLTLDFEGVSPSDRAAFSQFVEDLASSLHAHDRLLAVAVPASTGNPASQWSAAYDDSKVAAAADTVILMAYAFRSENSSVAGPISPFPWVSTVLTFAMSAVPAEKLVLGVGMWGYDWNTTVGGRATAMRYSDTVSLIESIGGQLSHDQINVSSEYQYAVANQKHDVWYEDASTIQRKVALARDSGLAGVALWRLGQEPPEIWNSAAPGGASDYAISGGRFFPQAGSGSGRGYRVIDDTIRFWSEFQRYGGIDTLGYPISRRYVGSDGFTYQAFQRGILQWRPDLNLAYLANTFDQLSAAGKDSLLLAAGIPLPVADDGSGGEWNRARATRLSWLTDPAISATFIANPNPRALRSWNLDRAIDLYGLPESVPVRSGPFVVQRFQRISLQRWVDPVPGMPSPGSVVGVLGGDWIKQAGIVPSDAAEPELAL